MPSSSDSADRGRSIIRVSYRLETKKHNLKSFREVIQNYTLYYFIQKEQKTYDPKQP
jgi:hypothetical protein